MTGAIDAKSATARDALAPGGDAKGMLSRLLKPPVGAEFTPPIFSNGWLTCVWYKVKICQKLEGGAASRRVSGAALTMVVAEGFSVVSLLPEVLPVVGKRVETGIDTIAASGDAALGFVLGGRLCYRGAPGAVRQLHPGGRPLAGLDGSGIHVSADACASWVAIGSGLAN